MKSAAAIAGLALLAVAIPLWAEDVRLLKDMDPTGHVDSGGLRLPGMLGGLVVVNGRLVFGADDGVHGYELWVSDGTSAGTTLLKDITPGPSDGVPSDLVSLGTVGVFRVQLGSEAGLWRTDGTEEGTFFLSDVGTGGPFHGVGVGAVTAQPFSLFTVAGRFAYFNGFDAEHGWELWKTDGTPDGTGIVKDLVPGPGDADPEWIVAMEDRVFFVARHQTAGGTSALGLFVSDGSDGGTHLVSTGEATDLQDVGRMLFYVRGTSGGGAEVRRTDGTSAGTLTVAKFDAAVRPLVSSLASSGSRLFFHVLRSNVVAASATGGNFRTEVWTSDGTVRGTYPVLTGESPVSSATAGLRGIFYFWTGAPGELRLWRSDGTPNGTRRIRTFGESDVLLFPRSFFVLDDRLLFAADDGVSGTELWESDGTKAGTRLVADVAPGAAGSHPDEMTLLGSQVLFTADDGSNGFALWALDAPPSLSAHDTRVVESRCPPGADFQVTLSRPSDRWITVDYTTADGTARAGLDYRPASGTLSFAPGTDAAVVTVEAIPNLRVDRRAKTFSLVLDNASVATLRRPTASATLRAGLNPSICPFR
jgi:ELWxxDGT repeat protein